MYFYTFDDPSIIRKLIVIVLKIKQVFWRINVFSIRILNNHVDLKEIFPEIKLLRNFKTVIRDREINGFPNDSVRFISSA